MNKYGFIINRLRAKGEVVEPTDIYFKKGLNVISGESDTGKSYILDCLDFMLGAQQEPKPIPEGEGYQTLQLELEDHNGNVWTLQRSLKGGQFLRMESSIDNITDKTTVEELLPKHNETKKNNISAFLLNLSGLGEAKVRKNQYGETKNASFRVISNLFIVDETSIQAALSPITRDERTDATSAKWAFNYILTGEDDKAIIAVPRPEISKAKHEARLQLYDELIESLDDEIKGLSKKTENYIQKNDALTYEIEVISNSISLNNKALAEYQEARKIAWDSKKKEESRVIVIDELTNRFSLLYKHYESDIKRLDYISEGEHYFSQLENISCPVCGTFVDEHTANRICAEAHLNIPDIQVACQKEAEKIKKHMADLQKTLDTLKAEKQELIQNIKTNTKIVKDMDKHITDIIQPKIFSRQSKLSELISNQKILSKLTANQEQLKQLREEKKTLQEKGPDKPEYNFTNTLSKSALLNLCASIKDILIEWKYPGTETIVFDEQAMDIVIDGKPRQHSGKGYRSVSHAAFLIGLLDYCISFNRPHPKLVVLDSPLVPLREQMAEENNYGLSGGIEQAFYTHLAKKTKDRQIIIIENKNPPEDIHGSINYIDFTRSENGRAGFYPVSGQV